MPIPPQIVVGIPGSWPSRTALVQDIALKSGYLFVGRLLMNLQTNECCEMEVYDHDPHSIETFTYGAQGLIPPADLQAIASHTTMVYLIGEAGSQAAKRMLDATEGMLRAGGIAVNVESAGKAHSRQNWAALAVDENPVALYHAYVMLRGNSEFVYSSGMQNLGLPDVILNTTIPDTDTAHLLETFLLYTFMEKPDLHSGHTFSLNLQSPYYRITLEPCSVFAEDHPCFNPFGVWRMERI
jgi:hypothetical protein